jgi:polysaccharide export outer membrane protein
MVQGKTPRQIEADIVQRLRGKANQPQVIVRVANNASANVTVVGEVSKSLRMPLTPKGERLLDAIAAAGGVSQPTNKTTVQLSRMGKVVAMPMDQIIQDPAQNVHLQPGDVVTAVTKPLSMTVLGATGKNEEVNFEAQGISLAQAMGRAGGLADNRADARGLFVFRFEDPMVLPEQGKGRIQTAEGKVPVVYRVDLSDPRSFLVAQQFPIKHQDVVYVSNAPAAELQKFLNILTSTVFTAAGLGSLGSN